MERRSSRIWLWVLAVVVGIVVIAGGALTIYIVSENDDAREQRCLDVVSERLGDRLLWEAILRSIDTNGTSESVEALRHIVNEFKPPLQCDRDNIPIEVELEGGP